LKDSRFKNTTAGSPALSAALPSRAALGGYPLFHGSHSYQWTQMPPMPSSQTNYIDALAAKDKLTVHEGHYLEKTQRCNGCGATWKAYEEKMTDVNIAAQMLADAYEDRFDTAFIISGDSDLTTPIQQVRKRFPDKRLIVVFPPNRQSAQLKKAANGFLSIGEDKLRQNQLSDPVITASGFALHRPAHWR